MNNLTDKMCILNIISKPIPFILLQISKLTTAQFMNCASKFSNSLTKICSFSHKQMNIIETQSFNIHTSMYITYLYIQYKYFNGIIGESFFG